MAKEVRTSRGPRSFALLLVAGVALAAGRPVAQQMSVDDIVQKNIDAKGGLAKLKAVATIRQTASLSMQGTEAGLIVYSKRPNLIRQEITVGGQVVINGFDGQTAWIVNPNVSQRAIVVTGPQAEQIKDQSNFDGPLVDYKAQGTVIGMNGAEMLGTRRVLHLRLTSAYGQRTELYLDAQTYLEARLSTQNGQLRVDQEFSEYREHDGLMVPFLIRTLTNGVVQSELKVQTLEFNAKIEDSLFRLPKEVRLNSLQNTR